MNCKEAWFFLLDTIRKEGNTYTDQEGRACQELVNFILSIDDGHDAIDLVREMQRHDAWVYPTPDELKSIIVGSPAEGAHEYSYVPRLFGGMNQIDLFVIPVLKANKQSRRALAVLYQPEQDSNLTSTNVPGFVSIHFRILNEALDITCHLRSNDAFVGFPANLYQLRCLQEYVATKLGVQLGPMHVFSSSAHYFPQEYEDDFQAISKAVRKEH